MPYIIQITFAIIAGSLLLAFLTNTLAYEVSRIMEALFDEIECRLAEKHQRRATRLNSRIAAYNATPSVHVEI